MEDMEKINVYVSVEAKQTLKQFKLDHRCKRQDDALDALLKDWDRMNKEQQMDR